MLEWDAEVSLMYSPLPKSLDLARYLHPPGACLLLSGGRGQWSLTLFL